MKFPKLDVFSRQMPRGSDRDANESAPVPSAQDERTEIPTATEADLFVSIPESQKAADSLVHTIKQFRADMQLISARLKSEHESQVAADKKRIEQAQKVVGETDLGNALCRLLREFWAYPSRPNAQEFADYKKSDMKITDTGETREGDRITKHISFEYAEVPYRFVFESEKAFIGEVHRIRIEADGKLVCAMPVFHPERSHDSLEYSPLPVEALEIGSWIAHLAELDEKLKIGDQKAAQDFERKMLHEKAARLPD